MFVKSLVQYLALSYYLKNNCYYCSYGVSMTECWWSVSTNSPRGSWGWGLGAGGIRAVLIGSVCLPDGFNRHRGEGVEGGGHSWCIQIFVLT